jgi:hypothetical protein
MIGLAVMASGFLVRTSRALSEAREEVAQLAVADDGCASPATSTTCSGTAFP